MHEKRKEAEIKILRYLNRRNKFSTYVIDCNELGFCLVDFVDHWLVAWITPLTLDRIVQESKYDKS